MFYFNCAHVLVRHCFVLIFGISKYLFMFQKWVVSFVPRERVQGQCSYPTLSTGRGSPRWEPSTSLRGMDILRYFEFCHVSCDNLFFLYLFSIFLGSNRVKGFCSWLVQKVCRLNVKSVIFSCLRGLFLDASDLYYLPFPLVYESSAINPNMVCLIN